MKSLVVFMLISIFSFNLVAQDKGNIPPGPYATSDDVMTQEERHQLKLAARQFRQKQSHFIEMINNKRKTCKRTSKDKNLYSLYSYLLYRDAVTPQPINESDCENKVHVGNSNLLNSNYESCLFSHDKELLALLEDLLTSPAYHQEMLKKADDSIAVSKMTDFYWQIVKDYADKK